MKIYLETYSLMLIFQLALAYSIQQQFKSISQFCWKDSYGRGVGTIPSQCESHRDKIGLLCYSKCPKGFARFGFDCHQSCPYGFSNQGLFCRINQYGRGVGYPWHFSDGFTNDGMRKRCQKDYGKGNCERNGLIIYPKCKQGYHAFGCCICRPKTPNCSALGFSGGFDLSCAKKIIIGDPMPMKCGNGLQKDVGLCYKPCDKNYNGVGPVCWGKNPRGWTGCGMGSAKSSSVCASTIFGQIFSAGNLAFNIFTFGISKSATATTDAAKISELRKKFQQLKEIYNKSADLRSLVSKTISSVLTGKSIGEMMAAKPEEISTEDILRLSAQIAALADPTGVSSVVAAFTYPKCSKIIV